MLEVIYNKPELFFNNRFSQIEKEFTTEKQSLRKEFNNKLKEIEKNTQIEMNLLKFELYFISEIDKKKLDSFTKNIRKERDSTWKKAMKIAKGDINKAMEIYGELD